MEEKILLYYKFVPLADPTAVMLWQTNLCKRLDLYGRIIVSEQGINGTVGGNLKSIKAYVKETREYAPFNDIEFKRSEGKKSDFPRLSVKVRDELVTFGAGDRVEVDEGGVVGTGVHLKPAQLHELHEQYGDDLHFVDGRNAYEASIGKFKGAHVPNTRTTKDFLDELNTPEFQALKDKPVVTYCTGGIRCEVLSSLMLQEGFKEVYQVDGGIVKYGKAYGDDGLWEGSVYVFDKRRTLEFSDHTKVLGECSHCGSKTTNFENCSEPSCNDIVLICKDCLHDETPYCSEECRAKGTVV